MLFPILIVDGVCETMFTAVADTAAVGHVGFCESNGIASVRQLYVSVHFRHKGVGTALMQRCIDEAVSAKCSVINLCVAHNNTGVIPFYERLGFFLVADAGDWWMAKRL